MQQFEILWMHTDRYFHYESTVHNNDNISKFLSALPPVLDILQKENTYAAVVGDFNINLLQSNEREKVDLMCTNSFYPKITLPTRFSKHSCSLIDQFFCKVPHKDHKNISSSIVLSSISDHFPCIVKVNILHESNNPPKYRIIQLWITFETTSRKLTSRQLSAQTWRPIQTLNALSLSGLSRLLMKSTSRRNGWNSININIKYPIGLHAGFWSPSNFVITCISVLLNYPRTLPIMNLWNIIWKYITDI